MATQIKFGTSGWRAVIAEEFTLENVRRADLFAKVGSFYPLRENFRLTPEVKQKFTEKLRRDLTEFDGMKVASVVRTDGLKLLLADGSWVCYRLSGTEPGVRVYSEARSEEGIAKFSSSAKAWIFN
jgi:phosphomannomutase